LIRRNAETGRYALGLRLRVRHACGARPVAGTSTAASRSARARDRRNRAHLCAR
jgi:hypothetical protein